MTQLELFVNGQYRHISLDGRPVLHHTPQVFFGCLWHAAFAITGDKRLLDFTDEVSNERYLVTLAAHGWVERTWWNQALLEQPCNWEALASTIPASSLHGTGYRKLYLCFRTGKLLHCAAMLYPFDPDQPHIISDSCSSTFFVMRNRRDFLETPHAKAFMVSELLQARLELYPSRLVSRGQVFEMEACDVQSRRIN